ncbi:MAG: GGDEF domain-containing protein, partial [Planctomycetota bacterium]|nr:GGDEF domain-containing protein [Planctomycetota bacterium]
DVLTTTADLLRDTVGPLDHVGRVGGEEFAVAAVAAEPGHGEELAKRIVRSFREHAWHQLRPGMKLTCSVGVAVLEPARMSPNHETDLARLIDQADKALYKVKQGTRNNYEVYTALSSSSTLTAPPPVKIQRR